MDGEVLSTYPTEAFLSKDYLQAEKKLLWPKVWQMVERVEDLPNPGDWMTYNVADESVIVLRKDDGSFKAFHNVCPHRGRQLVSVPDMLPGKVHDVRGSNRKNFICGFHGWTFDTEGNNTYILDPQDWDNKLTPEMTCLSEVQVDTWGGYIYINMDPDCVPLKEWMGRAGEILEHFDLAGMRYKWRQWAIYDCNWKTAIEAFLEPYHVAGTHTQLLAYGDYYALSKQYGLHSVSSYDTRETKFQMSESAGTTRAGKGDDARVSTYELIRENYETVNYSASTETLVKAASRLVDELPETATPAEIIGHWLKSAKADDAARGVIWPEVPPAIKQESGLAWGLFPNQNILHGETFALCYRVRPYGDDPDKCVFESYALERFPEGEEPQTEWVYADPTGENWGSVLAQDFSNMQFVQKGMKSSGFRGPLPNPHQEQKVINLHRNLANFMEGRGAPTRLDPD
ncbi:aromatic ring-hydroxylating oxygenase subunit alpha [Novosphingobium beihaiensis]